MPSCNLTEISFANSTTWEAVKIEPSLSIITPDPNPPDLANCSSLITYSVTWIVTTEGSNDSNNF